MFITLDYKVAFKDAPKEAQQSRTFHTKEAALAFAITIERDGGMAVVTQEHRLSPISSALPYTR